MQCRPYAKFLFLAAQGLLRSLPVYHHLAINMSKHPLLRGHDCGARSHICSLKGMKGQYIKLEASTVDFYFFKTLFFIFVWKYLFLSLFFPLFVIYVARFFLQRRLINFAVGIKFCRTGRLYSPDHALKQHQALYKHWPLRKWKIELVYCMLTFRMKFIVFCYKYRFLIPDFGCERTDGTLEIFLWKQIFNVPSHLRKRLPIIFDQHL